MDNNIQRLIELYLSTDDSFSANNQNNIIKIYNKLSSLEKRNIDSLFIELCGHSMETILNEIDIDTKRSFVSEETLKLSSL